MMARGHVDVNERRLRPIYDALDNGDNKKAIQEADRLLKKQKELLCAKALKALALLRLGKLDDAVGILQELRELTPTDDNTLQAMSIAFKELQKYESIVEVYENAHKADPTNEETLTHLFMAYVRMHKFKLQHQTAMKLHKLCPSKNPYYYWAIMSVVMQAYSTVDTNLVQNMFLPLAERMACKHYEDGKMEAEAEVMLYIMVLEKMGKYEKALQVVKGPTGARITSELNFQEEKEVELLEKLGRWKQVNTLSKKRLKVNMDDWRAYQSYLRSSFSLVQDKPAAQENGEAGEEDVMKGAGDAQTASDSSLDATEADDSLEKVVAFLKSLKDLTANERIKVRGPYLATIDLRIKLDLGQDFPDKDSLKLESLEDLLLEYLECFSHKFCCYNDLRLYVLHLSEDSRPQFIEKIMGKYELKIPENDIKEKMPLLPDIQRNLTSIQLSRHLGSHSHLCVEEKIQLAKEYLTMYKRTSAIDKTLYSTDFRTIDQYVLLAIHLLYDTFKITGDQKVLWWCIVVLEIGKTASPANYQLKLLLMQFYSVLGAFGPCPALYDGLEIKHLQHDTLGYLVTNHITRLAHMSSACTLYETMLRFYTLTQKETSEYLIQAYKTGSFGKVVEFVQFRERLKHSFQFAQARVERMMLDLNMEAGSQEGSQELVEFMDIVPEHPLIPPVEMLNDSRDLSIMSCWDPPEDGNEDKEMYASSFKEELLWVRYRSILLRCIAAVILLPVNLQHEAAARNKSEDAQNNTEDTTPAELHRPFAHLRIGGKVNAPPRSSTDILEKLLNDLSENENEAVAELKDVSMYHITGPSPTRFRSYLRLGLGKMFRRACQLLIRVTQGREREELQTIIKELVDNIEDLVKKSQVPVILEQEEEGIEINTNSIEQTLLVNEFLGQVTMVLGSLEKVTQPSQQLNPSTKKGKKKKQAQSVEGKPAVVEDLKLLWSCVNQSFHQYLQYFFSMEQTTEFENQIALQSFQVDQLLHIIMDESIAECRESIVHDSKVNVCQSICLGAHEMKKMVEQKIKYMSSISF